MKKSELYRLAMNAVLDSEYRNEIKLEMLKVLFEDESVALFTEEREAQEDAE